MVGGSLERASETLKARCVSVVFLPHGRRDLTASKPNSPGPDPSAGAAAAAEAPRGPSRAALTWVSIALLAAGLAVTLVALLRRPDRVVLVPFDDVERGWYQARLADFAEKKHVRLTLVAYKDGAELRRLLSADELQRKGRVIAALTPGEMLAPLASDGAILPVESYAGKGTNDLLAPFAKETVEPARVSGLAYYVPDHVSTLCVFYAKSRVADAVEHWQDVRAKVDADLAAWNGTGLPDEYALESDPNRWDSYDLTVVATYWATREFEGLTVPRVAHAAALEGGADWDLASRCYGAGAENSELAALDGLGLRDAFAWESYWFAHGLYHPSMTRESWGRREILSAIAQGQIFLAPLTSADFFRLHGTADGGGDGLLKNPADLGIAQWPQAMSLEIERGYPARSGNVRAARGGGWWGVPKSSPDPSLALAFVEHVTSTEFATAHCRKFGVLPARLDVLQELDEVLKDAWQFDIARAAKRQALTLGRTMPSSDRWLTARAGLVAAWKDACVTRHEKAPIALQEALTNQASLAGSAGSSAGSSR
jgi:ABC-type glycerol-3-phosphate transport system substrate-binding protein